MERKILIAANWKMNKTVEESISFVKDFKDSTAEIKDVDILICPPYIALSDMGKLLKNTNIKLGAQNMYFEEKGAFTGEISPVMLKKIGCEYVILGHSDRREYFNETNELVNKKIIAALRNDLKPILCIGETLEQRNSNKTKEVLESQLKECLIDISKKEIKNVVIAYEPLWAISKGDPNHKAATAEDAEEGHKFIRNYISKLYDENTAENIIIIYGGSMKPGNAEELLGKSDIDGGLVGNASLDVKSFVEILQSSINL